MLASCCRGVSQLVSLFLSRSEQVLPNQSVPFPHLAVTSCLLLGRLSSFTSLPAVLFSCQPLLAPGGGAIILELRNNAEANA